MEVALRPVFSVSKAATANLRNVATKGVLESLNVEDRWKHVLLSCSGTKEDSESLEDGGGEICGLERAFICQINMGAL